jgi:hypothetical protein
MISVCSTHNPLLMFLNWLKYIHQQLVDRKRMHGKVKINFHCLSVFIQLSHHLGKRQLKKHVGLYHLVCLSGELTLGQQPYR